MANESYFRLTCVRSRMRHTFDGYGGYDVITCHSVQAVKSR